MQAILVTNLTANLSTETMKVRRHWAKIWMGNLQIRKWKWNVILKELGKMSPENSKSRKNILLKWIYFPHEKINGNKLCFIKMINIYYTAWVCYFVYEILGCGCHWNRSKINGEESFKNQSYPVIQRNIWFFTWRTS